VLEPLVGGKGALGDLFALARLPRPNIFRHIQGGIAMLVLSRKEGQKIRISDEISITVLEIRGGKVKLGLCGPPEVSFQREEVYERIRAGIPQPETRQHDPETIAA
jgi:carbon storage regulator